MADLLERLQQALDGRYVVDCELGRGGMATVFLARDPKLERAVAIKVLHEDLAQALGADRFRREIQIATRLTHPHILSLYDSGDAGGLLYYVMPYVHGESLRARLTREQQLPVDEAVRIACEVAGALDYAHREGVVHRDIKPENILLEDGHAIVADFGIARAIRAMGDTKLTQTGVTLGTPTYMSPEQAMGARDLDGRSDIYSLGCVLYEMLAGTPPFVGPTAQAIIARHTLDSVPSLTIVRGTVPEEIEEAILIALAKVPADRFASAGAFADALGGGRATTSRRAVTRAVAANRRGLRDRRLRRLAIAAGIALVLLSGAGGIAWRMWPRPAAASARAAGGLDPRDIAVLYFADLSRDSTLGFLADGLTESLIGELGRVNTLRVVSANGVRPYRDEAIAADSVARALRVGTVIDGSVEAEGDKVEVQIRLVEGESGGAINRAAFTRPAGDLLALRDSVAATAAALIRESIGDEVRLKRRRAGTSSADAWGLLQRGERLRKSAEALLHEDDAAGSARAFAAADSALAAAEALDPRWSEPMVARGQLAYRQARLTREPGRAGRFIEASLRHVERALALDPRNADALELRGTLNFLQVSRGFAHDSREAESLLASAETDLTAATAENPAQAGAWSTLSALHYLTSDIPQAKIAAQRAYEADAYLAVADAVLWRLFLTSYDLAAFADAERWCQEGNRRFPAHPRFAECQLWIMTSSYPEPDAARAWALLNEWKSRTPDPHVWELEGRKAQMAVAAVLARAGQADSARHVLERARATAEIDPTQDLLWVEAFVRTLLKENDAAIDIITRAVAANPEHRAGLTRREQWWWNDLRADPRFQRLAGSGG